MSAPVSAETSPSSAAPNDCRISDSTWRPLCHPTFRALWIASIVSNVARAIGPALGGLVVALAGPGAVFLLNAASFLGTIFVLYRWQRTPRRSILPGERLLGAMKAGVRYTRYAPAFQAVLMRTIAFT